MTMSRQSPPSEHDQLALAAASPAARTPEDDPLASGDHHEARQVADRDAAREAVSADTPEGPCPHMRHSWRTCPHCIGLGSPTGSVVEHDASAVAFEDVSK